MGRRHTGHFRAHRHERWNMWPHGVTTISFSSDVSKSDRHTAHVDVQNTRTCLFLFFFFFLRVGTRSVSIAVSSERRAAFI